jgi:outer membrane protein TolC
MKRRLVVAVFLIIGFTKISYAQEEVSLEQVIALALEKNYDVRIAKVVSESADTDKDYAWGAFLPQLNATGAVNWNANDQTIRNRVRDSNDIETREGPTASNNLTGAVQLNWTLFDGTRMFATRERIGVLAEQGELLIKNQMVNTIADVITFYYDIVRQKQQLKAIQEQMSVSEERVKLAQRKLDVGTGIKPELLQARVDFNAQRSQVIQQESIIIQLKEQLNALVGLQLPTVYDVADTIIIDFNLQPEQITQNVENTNFALRASRESIHVASLTLRERRAEYLPFLNFNAAYTYSKQENTQLINPFGLLYNQQNGYNYGLSVNLPILNGFNTKRLNQQARIEVDRQTLLFDQLKTNINVGLKNAYVNYDNAKKILSIEEENIGLAKENVFIALEGFKRGVTTYIELRTAQQSLADAYNSLIAARYNTKIAETELLRLSGALLR